MTTQDEKRLTLRLPDSLHSELVQLAEEDYRSLQGEIIVLLKEAIMARKETKTESPHTATNS